MERDRSEREREREIGDGMLCFRPVNEIGRPRLG